MNAQQVIKLLSEIPQAGEITIQGRNAKVLFASVPQNTTLPEGWAWASEPTISRRKGWIRVSRMAEEQVDDPTAG